MRKLVFLPAILALCVCDFSAFGATNRRGTTGTAGAKTVSAPVARSATRSTAVRGTVPGTTPGVTAARAASTRGAKVVNSPVTARAGSQKVINMGTKVKSATGNTVVSQECQDAYYGCMDAFCMLDNTSGGRCQCSDRNAELNSVLEEIMKLDEQSLAMATEGVERLQMGENAEEIMARAKAAAESVKVSAETSGTSTKRKLDLSLWRSGDLFSDAEVDFDDDNIFEMTESTLADKSGDALAASAAKICVERIPAECKASGSFLQLTYAQKIKSDCSAYENSLKQQRSASAEKLQTAQKALRDAALEMYQNENKYDFGQCVTQFKMCMQTTGECGEDFSGCIADLTILDKLYSKKSRSNNVATTTIKTGVTSVTISSASYDLLNTKRVMCESVTKQCVNANKKDAVWQQVLKDLAPVVYTAEYNAASNNRMNCITTVANCVRTACGSKWDDNSDNFDACLSDPDSIDNYCKLEYNRCGDGDATSGTVGSVRTYVMAKLAAMKVDACTREVKECLLSEDRCGEDYSGCVGLDTDSVVDLCPEDKLIACQSRSGKYANTSVREYIAQIAQGIALNLDNQFAVTCQNAIDGVLERVCGFSEDEDDTDDCPGLALSNNEIDGSMHWQFCGPAKDSVETVCADDLIPFSNESIKNGLVYPAITGKLDELSKLKFDKKGKCDGASADSYFCVADDSEPTGILGTVLSTMNRDYGNTIAQIQADTTVNRCMSGREIQAVSTRKQGDGTEQSRFGRTGTTEGRFPNLMDEAESLVGNQVLSSTLDSYYAELTKVRESGKGEEMRNEISQRRQQILVAELSQKLMKGKDLCDLSSDEFSTLMSNEELISQMKQSQDEQNKTDCETQYGENKADFATGSGWLGAFFANIFGTGNAAKDELVRYGYNKGVYDSATNECVVVVKEYHCEKVRAVNKKRCKKWDTDNPVTSEKRIKMPEWNTPASNKFCQ